MPARQTNQRTSPDRSDHIVSCLEEGLAHLIDRDPEAFRRRFRRMAKEPFAFFRGSTPLFYSDVSAIDDPWAAGELARIWIHGDLHVENFGTYMDSRGVLVFDVNDFDEAYLGHFTWDLLRCAASIGLVAWRKAFPDGVIDELVGRYVRAYVAQVQRYVEEDDDHVWSLRLDNAEGAVRETLLEARRATRRHLLDAETALDGDRRRFRDGGGFRVLDDGERESVLAAVDDYLATIPADKRLGGVAYEIKDVAGRSGFGIGSAGLGAYNLLLEGRSQALQDDVVLSLKEGNVAAPGAVVHDERLDGAFDHHGHRTALSQRALQVHADPYLGWTRLDGLGYVVRELQPWEVDLDWDDVGEPDEVARLVEDLGRATAKVHCVSDADAESIIVKGHVEDLVMDRVGDEVDELVDWVRDEAELIAERTRADHAMFVDAFRGGAFGGVRAV
jgi:uncharacterized protein (DUF2252 family)